MGARCKIRTLVHPILEVELRISQLSLLRASQTPEDSKFLVEIDSDYIKLSILNANPKMLLLKSDIKALSWKIIVR